jgi:NADPH:quinone reductase-like Zn-dependent oxidoreductase
MKAILCETYGSPEVLQLREVEKLSAKENEVLVRILAASANPLDWHRMRGSPFLVRLVNGLRKPKNSKIGVDISGRVEALGRNATQFKPGDEVFGVADGSFAEYVSAADSELELKPANVSFEEAAAAPVAAFTALQRLRDKGQIQPGQKVLINGASGGVGTFEVQIAKSFGAEVTGVCSTRNLEMIRSIGADHVIDYTQEDFTKNGQRYDLIIAAVPTLDHSVSDYRRALNPQGICVVVGLSSVLQMFRVMFMGSLVSRAGGKKIGFMMAKLTKKDLIILRGLLEDGKLVPVIDRRYPLSEVPDVIQYLEQGHARGKVVIAVGHPDKPPMA